MSKRRFNERTMMEKAIEVMREAGVDISQHTPENVDRFLNGSLDWLVTVCDGAREQCPVFHGRVHHKVHIGFEDPAEATGTVEEKLEVFRRVRDEIRTQFFQFFENHLK